MKYVYFFDNSGLYTGFDLVPDDLQLSINATTINPNYIDSNGNLRSYYKAKWDGTKWVESITQDEINSINTVSTSVPTTEQQQIAQLLLITAQQAQQIATLQQAVNING